MWGTINEKDLLDQSRNYKDTEIDKERKDVSNLALNQNSQF